mmetsp:Transcript_56601/g.160642  ORF Transcript_56601/g.160642 Transcript_56601/m.160642 type:complete len:396 (+) Transcript_56601:1006-2193(+)
MSPQISVTRSSVRPTRTPQRPSRGSPKRRAAQQRSASPASPPRAHRPSTSPARAPWAERPPLCLESTARRRCSAFGKRSGRLQWRPRVQRRDSSRHLAVTPLYALARQMVQSWLLGARLVVLPRLSLASMIPRQSLLSTRACETCLWLPRMLPLDSHRPLAGHPALSLGRAARRKPAQSTSQECPQEVQRLSFWAATTLMTCLQKRPHPTSLQTAPTRTSATPSLSGPPRAFTMLPAVPRPSALVWTTTPASARRSPPPASQRRSQARPSAARGLPRRRARRPAAPRCSALAATTRRTCSPGGRQSSPQASSTTRPQRTGPLLASTGTSRGPPPTASRTVPTRTAGTRSRSGRPRGCSRPQAATPRSASVATRLPRPLEHPPTSLQTARTRTPVT